MSEKEYRLDVCTECKVREGDASKKNSFNVGIVKDGSAKGILNHDWLSLGILTR